MRNNKNFLTNEEKISLEESGYSKGDIQQILKAINKTRYALVTDDNRKLTISESEAIERLGREEWVKGIARSTFYIDTIRFGMSGERIAMHSKVYA